jgi:hypothetical protein
MWPKLGKMAFGVHMDPLALGCVFVGIGLRPYVLGLKIYA